MFDKRTLRQIIDSISEKAKEAGSPHVAGGLLVDVMALRDLHEHLYRSSVPHHELLGHPVSSDGRTP